MVAIFLHLPPEVHPLVHQSLFRALKPGGLIILEGFPPAQLTYQQKYRSGGPAVLDLLYTPEMIRQDFAEAEVIELYETSGKVSTTGG